MTPHRIRILPLAAIAAVLLGMASVTAAPTCENQSGLTVRCGTEGAMPVGWRLPLEERQEQPETSPAQILEVLCVLGVFFGLMALLPDFENTRAAEWDREESDPEHRRRRG